MTWRNATRDEIYTFYNDLFQKYLEDFPPYLSATGPKEIGISFLDPHPVKHDEKPPREFIRRDTRSSTEQSVFTGWMHGRQPLLDFLTNPASHDPLRDTDNGLADPAILDKRAPVPDAVYHSLAHWERSHLVVIDIDAKDIAYDRASDLVETDGKSRQEVLTESGITTSDPIGYPYAFEDIRRALEYGFKVDEILRQDFNASETMVVYSGQGCHVYLLDDDRPHQYDTQSRDVLATFLLERHEIPIDKQVTIDSSRLIRVPYSLHTDVCRVVQPISSPYFDFRSEAAPAFLAQEVADS